MNTFVLIFFLANAIALLCLPRKWAVLPLLVGACYMSRGEGIEIGPISLPIIRLIILVGYIRVLIRQETAGYNSNIIDKIMFLWAALAVGSGFFHEDISAALVFRLGIVYNNLGIYILIRLFIRTLDDLTSLYRMIAILLIPLALEMLSERWTGNNWFSRLGGVNELLAMRDNGSYRAQGPFSHSILAGTVGAVCLPLMVSIWKKHKIEALLGTAACLLMVYASNSSGPMMTAFFSVVGLMMWRYRFKLTRFYVLGIFCFLVLLVFMNDPPYYIMAKIDLAGGSTGWYRARLIESAFEHFSEWWFSGTDYTRHWMPSGVQWSPNHTDITNYYLKMGVWGGLPLMTAFILLIVVTFSHINKVLVAMKEKHTEYQFMTWALWAMLLAHAVTCIAVSYYDQSFLFMFMTFAAVGSLAQSMKSFETESLQPSDDKGQKIMDNRRNSQPMVALRKPTHI